jgi:tetratricopeptide (TPR) repeat protein
MQKQWPTQASGYLLEAEVLIARKEPEQAERMLREAIERTKNPALVIPLYALLNREGHKKEAEAFASAWTTKNPNLQIDTLAGQMSIQRKDYAEAARWYRNIVKAQPNNVGALNNLAWALGQLQDPSALDYGQKALSLAPAAPAVLDTVGWLYVERGNVAQGLELLNKAHSLAPNTASIQLNLAKALIKAGQADAARQQLDVLAKLPAGSPIRDEAQKLLSTL